MASPKYDIDTYLNPFIPRNPVHHFPYPIAHFLGKRSPKYPQFQKKPHILLIWAWCFIGAFLGVALIEGVYLHLPVLGGHHVPVIIGSFGAAAILEYNTIESPLAQPRNLVFGHFLSAVAGVGITKLFRLLPHARFEQLRWLAGALSVGTASVIMAMTKTVHPPAGATALLCATSADITDLGWWVLALIVLACMLMLVSALLLNNLIRVWPVYWWTPADLKKAHQQKWGKKDDKGTQDVEKASEAVEKGKVEMPGQKSLSESSTGGDEANPVQEKHIEAQKTALDDQQQDRQLVEALQHEVVIRGDHIIVPDWAELSDFEVSFLEGLQMRLRERSNTPASSSNNIRGATAADVQKQQRHLRESDGNSKGEIEPDRNEVEEKEYAADQTTEENAPSPSAGRGKMSWYHSVTD